MTTAEPDRLDAIEHILKSVAANQQQMQVQPQSPQQPVIELGQQSDQRIAAIAQHQQRTQQPIDDVGQAVRESIAALTTRVSTVRTNLDEVAAELRSILSADAASRAAERLAETRLHNEFRTAMLGLQTETRTIWHELAELRQQRQNGNSTSQE